MRLQSLRVLIFASLTYLFTTGTAGAVTFNLDCVLQNASAVCGVTTFGTVTIEDISGGVSVVVDTATGGKFKDLYLNLDAASPVLTSPAIFSSNGFTLAPYDGLFDVGTKVDPGGKGFDGSDNVAFNILGSGFTAANFGALDSLGLVNVGIHLQEIDCTVDFVCVSGSGSIKVGGSILTPPGDVVDTPEPATILISGAGLAAIWFARRRRG